MKITGKKLAGVGDEWMIHPSLRAMVTGATNMVASGDKKKKVYDWKMLPAYHDGVLVMNDNGECVHLSLGEDGKIQMIEMGEWTVCPEGVVTQTKDKFMLDGKILYNGPIDEWRIDSEKGLVVTRNGIEIYVQKP